MTKDEALALPLVEKMALIERGLEQAREALRDSEELVRFLAEGRLPTRNEQVKAARLLPRLKELLADG